MEWITGLTFLPVLACGLMMGAMALGGILGLRRSQQSGAAVNTTSSVDEDLVGSRR